jgi:hypothetical protein
MRHIWIAALAALATAAPPACALAQDGPSLAETLGYIKDKLEAEGVVAYAANYTDTSNNNSWVNQYTDETGNIRPSGCVLTFHFKYTRDGKTLADGDYATPLDALTDVQVMTGETALRTGDAAAGHPTFSAQLTPEVWVLKLVARGGGEKYFYLSDQDRADRLAKAFVHGAQLCGSMKPDLF